MMNKKALFSLVLIYAIVAVVVVVALKFLGHSSVTISAAFFPGIELMPQTYDVRLIYIPLLLRYNFSKYLFINGGLIADIDISKELNISNQSSAGASIGLGTELFFSENFSVQINPYMNFHGLIMINREDYPERILDAGVKLCFLIYK